LKLSLCGSDIRMLHHAAPECYPFPVGTTGHEMVGVVEDVDPSSPLAPGDLTLTLAPGHRAMCEHYLAPLEHVLPLPSGAPLEHLLQAQQFGTVIYACKRLPNIIGQDVAIIGQGSAGLWFAFQLRRMGARRVIAIDLDAGRLALSAHFGTTDTIHNENRDALALLTEMTGGRLVDLVIEAAGEVDALNLAVDLVKKNGRILFFGYPRGQRLHFNFEEFFHKCCDATTIVGVSDEPNLTSTRLALATIAAGEIDVAPLITHHFPFERVIEAYELHRTRGEGAIKIVIDMPL
jgi:threonine dehydrogenase-like Zn-dependent dehydrogenase